jgi:hypothetical protein
VDVRGLKGFRQRHRRQEGGEPPGQPRLPRPRGAEQQNVMNTTPASPLPSRPRLGVGADHEAGAGAAPAAVPAGPWVGNVTLKVEPWPSVLVTVIVPPCRSTSACVMARPNPVPPTPWVASC